MYGLVHRGDCINCEMSFLFRSSFCVAESWVRRLSLCLACKTGPFFVTVTIMYNCNLQVNYMVTVFIRCLLLFSLYVCFHVLNVLFACVFSNTDTVSWLVCEQVLFVRFYNNPAPLNGSMQFHYCTLVTREPEQTTLLF